MINLGRRILREARGPGETAWMIVPNSDTSTRVYLIGTFVLYFLGAIYFLTHVHYISQVTDIPFLLWGASMLIVSLFQVWAVFDLRYHVFRVQAILTLTWAMAYEINLIFTGIRYQGYTVGLILWAWVVMVHALMARARLTWLMAPKVTSDTAATAVALPEGSGQQVERLKELVDNPTPPSHPIPKRPRRKKTDDG